MTVSELIEHLKMFGENTQVYITTNPDDLCQVISRKNISLIHSSHDERYGLIKEKVLLTAYIPNKGD